MGFNSWLLSIRTEPVIKQAKEHVAIIVTVIERVHVAIIVNVLVAIIAKRSCCNYCKCLSSKDETNEMTFFEE